MKSKIDILGYILLGLFFFLQTLKLIFENIYYIWVIDILISLIILVAIFLIFKKDKYN